MNQAYLHSEPASTIEFLEVHEIQTIVQRVTDYPMAEMAAIFDSTFEALFPLLEAEGIQPTGPAFSLHHRQPTDTATLEVGMPVNKLLRSSRSMESGAILEPSTLPGGIIARISHIGAYDQLPTAWGEFMESIVAAGKQPKFPLWEVYVSEPTPEMDASTLRTDLIALVGD